MVSQFGNLKFWDVVIQFLLRAQVTEKDSSDRFKICRFGRGDSLHLNQLPKPYRPFARDMFPGFLWLYDSLQALEDQFFTVGVHYETEDPPKSSKESGFSHFPSTACISEVSSH